MAALTPAIIQNASGQQLAAFLKEGKLTLPQLNRVKNVNLLADEQLMELIRAGACTFPELQQCGLMAKRQQEMRKQLALWDIENEFWQNALSADTVAAYDEYLAAFPAGAMRAEAEQRRADAGEAEMFALAQMHDEDHMPDAVRLYRRYAEAYPEGRFAAQAAERLKHFEAERQALHKAIFDDMKTNAWKYTSVMMRALFEGTGGAPVDISSLPADDVAARFLGAGYTLSYDDLVQNGVIPRTITQRELISPEFNLPQITCLDAFPAGRTDIYFLGVPRSGKSSVLAGLFNAMDLNGNWQYIPNLDASGRDGTLDYYNGLIRSVHSKKPPIPTADETINYINIDVPDAAGSSHTANLNFVEISGECFKTLAQSLGDKHDEWEKFEASRALANANRKVLFFLLDYNVILGHQDGITIYDQQDALKNALIIFSNDGTGPDRRKGCTMSKVDSVGVILTKADLMNTPDRQQRVQIALEYLHTNFRSFMNVLAKTCRDFGINRADGYAPYVMTFSLGRFYPGNTMVFDPADSLELAKSIESLVCTKRRGGIFF